ncbi:hypothetical protein [Novosphingobium olei]|uniref:Uncharacterized protein n=1 Tax=Novosphingobium olei TaxID=2728851 RepID=A0A7Y0BQT3_9SPHN|nr:hypothetical protein [Novosphingobium olei]NML94743.1 hypothetical protein [Novosphingobium olei]
MTDHNHAAALKLQQDGAEITALLIENLTAAANREGRQLEPADLTHMIGPLLSATWALAKQALPANERAARQHYAEFLRRYADGVEAIRHEP